MELATRSVALAAEARRRLAIIVNPRDAARFVYDIKAIRDRISKVRLDGEQAYEAAFPWNMAWLEGMRHTGGLLERGQEAGTVRTAGRHPKEANSLSLGELELEHNEAARWQRLAGIEDEDWRVFEEELYGDRKEPTLTAALRLADLETPDPDRPWLRVYNIWNFAKNDERFGMGHPGNIPGQINQNLNYYLTQPGDLIVDLFAGGGTTLDVCKYEDDDFGNRKCLAFDRKPVRPDIKPWDLTNGLPDFPAAAMVFLDPPYWGQKAGEYSGDDSDLANMPLERFNKTLAAVVEASLKRARCVALIIGATQKDGELYDHAAGLMGAFGAPRHRFIVPYSTEQYKAFDVVRVKKAKTYLNIYRDLMVWQS
jgi:hypothetical protein